MEVAGGCVLRLTHTRCVRNRQHLAGTEEEGKIFSMFAINMFITLLAFSVTFLARAYIYSTGFNLGYRLE